jgi:hypothetical protein
VFTKSSIVSRAHPVQNLNQEAREAMQYFGRFTDEAPDERIEDDEPIQSWTEADEGDARYDAMIEDRATWPGNEDRVLMRIGSLCAEDDIEMAIRCAAPMPRKEAA